MQLPQSRWPATRALAASRAPAALGRRAQAGRVGTAVNWAAARSQSSTERARLRPRAGVQPWAVFRRRPTQAGGPLPQRRAHLPVNWPVNWPVIWSVKRALTASRTRAALGRRAQAGRVGTAADRAAARSPSSAERLRLRAGVRPWAVFRRRPQGSQSTAPRPAPARPAPGPPGLRRRSTSRRRFVSPSESLSKIGAQIYRGPSVRVGRKRARWQIRSGHCGDFGASDDSPC